MIAETKEETLTNSASKFEALLYQFIKLYDRLTVEHNLITERELKIVTKLEKLDQTLKELDKKMRQLDQLSPEIKTEATQTICVAIKDNWQKLSNDVLDKTQWRVSIICDNLHRSSSRMEKMVHEYEEMKQTFNFKIWFIILLLGLITGAGGSYFYLKKISKCIVVDLEVYKKLQKNKD